MQQGDRRSQSLGNLFQGRVLRSFPPGRRGSSGHSRGFPRARGVMRYSQEGTEQVHSTDRGANFGNSSSQWRGAQPLNEQVNGMGRETNSGRGRTSRRGRESERGSRSGSVNWRRPESLPDRNREKRQWPIGFKALEAELRNPPDVAILSLLSERSGYDVLIAQEENIRIDAMVLLFKVLAHCSRSKANRESLIALHHKTFTNRFTNQLSNFVMQVRREPDKAVGFFSDLAEVLQSFITCLINVAVDKLPELLDSCEMILNNVTFEDQQKQKDVKARFGSMKADIDSAKKKFEKEVGGKQNFQMYEGEPPEDFRELSVIPTRYDFSRALRPFLRRNITEGKYKDGEHYLDVQFRLLREDFIRPLRNGIVNFKSGVQSKHQDVRIYRNVKIDGSDIIRRELIHFARLKLPKKFNVESSKRFMFGNLVGFTNDDFETIYFASIKERDVKYLKDGMLGVKFEDCIDGLDFSTAFTMVESKAFFIAYKHVLIALQNLQGDQLPFQENLINVEKRVNPPAYLGRDTRYDLRAMKEMGIMKPLEGKTEMSGTPRGEDPRDSWPHLSNVLILGGVWPSSQELKLDESQYRAFHGALTKQVAIIQGPPGTGKTFLGLKITQVLLNNIEHWDTEYGSPILVLCYTNHALDQFLEGMLQFTGSVVRVGSRCKNPALEYYQIAKLARNLRMQRQVPGAIYLRNQELCTAVEDLECAVKKWATCLKNYENLEGILPLSTLKKEDIIPQHIEDQLTKKGDERVLSKWLLTGGPLERGNQDTRFAVTNQKEVNNQEEEDYDEWHDAEELLAIEEENRGVEDEEDLHSSVSYTVSYETKWSGLRSLLDYHVNLQQKYPQDWSIVEQIYNLDAQLKALTAGLGSNKKTDVKRIERDRFFDIWELDFYDRWALYHYWVEKLSVKIRAKLKKVELEFQGKNRALKEVRDMEYLHVMRKAAVVGMTTTAAAQYALLLQELAPSIVIIEEAAEILEAHVIASLTNECEHLIMIGDHQQLRPSTTVYELATKFGLNTSLFERMVKNGVSYETLAYQHRMRPSISRLLVPSVYENLLDHPSVYEYPNVLGMEKNVFFVDHQQWEKEESDDNQSHENQYEANLLMALCRHLMLQGYEPEDITILTPYTGQFFLLRKLQRKYAPCSSVRICVVDNFQGEESNIILLSLVRSNEEGNVGFLRIDNRICVALSRAKHGLYIAGNMAMLCSKSELWKTIHKTLLDKEMIGGGITLKCENHPDEQIAVSSGEDIIKRSPEGGCCRSCPTSLPLCGHPCPRVCHVTDRDHTNVRCNVACPKTICARDHLCPLKCWQECEPCEVPIKKSLPCGHTHTIPCHVKRKDYPCPTVVEKRIPTCDHIVAMACCKDPLQFKCPRPCDTRLECGHKCRLSCHQTKDPDHEEYRCFADCDDKPEGCSENHACTKKCYEECGRCMVTVNKDLPCGHEQKNVQCYKPPEEIECRKRCRKVLPCGHKCKKMCFQECGDCMEKVEKTVQSCSHPIKIECHVEPSAKHCRDKCVLLLKCRHPCQARCCDPCTEDCQQIVKTSKVCPRGHTISLPCYLQHSIADEEAWAYCLEPCGQPLDCSHTCSGMCGQCLNGRLHVTCAEPCGRQLVCGHSCKEACSKVCPPCQEMCPWKCNHSKCRKKCGIPCVPCKEPCTWQCVHLRCNKKCGEACSRNRCEEICQKKLPCGHECIGFCGDPCPPQCRVCNKEDLEDFILLGNETDEDARFVLLEDCGHAIEVEALEYWLDQKKDEIGVKKCPRCHHPIYNNRRYQDIILSTYKDVRSVKAKHFSMKLTIKRKEIEDILKDIVLGAQSRRGTYNKEVRQLCKALGLEKSNAVKKKQSFLSDGELRLLHFKAQILRKSSGLLSELRDPEKKAINSSGHVDVEEQLSSLVERVMSLKHHVTEQMERETDCEIHRIALLPSLWKLESRCNPGVQKILTSLQNLVKPTEAFRKVNETRVKELLRDAEKFVGQLGISETERQEILQAMGLKQGHWYKCPNGHVYCITECGGAMIESECPDCGAKIGGGSHALRSDNAVATEMDGARHGAWSEQNNMANFDLNLL